MPELTAKTPIETFIIRWKASGASERANYQLFLTELCELIGVEKPRPATNNSAEDHYCFERPVQFDAGDGRTTTNFIDLYKKDCFVLEAKQGADAQNDSEARSLGLLPAKTKGGTAKRDTRGWELSMKNAKEQALRYARSLPQSDGWPPFLVVVDVGYCIDLYSDFARQGKTYIPYPDPQHNRIRLEDLSQETTIERLRLLFADPMALDPSRRAAKVTRELAESLGKLAASLEASGHEPEKVATFLMRCLFTMFAEDVGLLPQKAFTNLITAYKSQIDLFPDALQALWRSMDTGGFAATLHAKIRQFNGKLFKDSNALPISSLQLDLLIKAAQSDWSHVEPAIFGTLLERALQPRERHKLGAHYTPRAYVERLVMPTVIEPLREEWEASRTAAVMLEGSGDIEAARKEVLAFHRRLCSVRILDPACGSGNFLYVTLEHLKRLESEVTEYLRHFPGQIGLDMTGAFTVTPEQFLGLEINPRAAAIADVVLWIGYLQWHFRTTGDAKRLDDPILRAYGNIGQQDAVLAFERNEPRFKADGQLVTRWDGVSTKPHPVTGLDMPDESSTVTLFDYFEPKRAIWPEADFIVGNPPFIGSGRMRDALGDGYAEALRNAYKGSVPESVDFVMFWWFKAAELLREKRIERFGFITTNSIKQTFNRRVIETQIEKTPNLSLVFAIPDHPWVDSSDGAAVRIAMTVAKLGNLEGRLLSIDTEEGIIGSEPRLNFKEKNGKIHADLSIGTNMTTIKQLRANANLSCPGVKLHGAGFIVSSDQAAVLGLGRIDGIENYIREYRNGKDITDKPRLVKVIDLYGLTDSEARERFPEIYQHLIQNVKPERDLNNRATYRNNWWIHGEPRGNFRPALAGLSRYIVTAETAKHRVFCFLESSVLPDNKLIAIASSDPFILGVLSSKIHVLWSLATGARLGVGNDPVYNNSRCFNTFPFPNPTKDERQSICSLAEQLDAHRKNRQALHPSLTMTEMYNVLEKIKADVPLNKKEQTINDLGLLSILLQLHQELDQAVARAYKWPTKLSKEDQLEHLVALNSERSAAEAQGAIQWLRPEYQNTGGANQVALGTSEVDVKTKSKDAKMPWPKSLSEQALALQTIIKASGSAISTIEILYRFNLKKSEVSKVEKIIASILETFVQLGLLRALNDGKYAK
jgi:hypothetical protein